MLNILISYNSDFQFQPLNLEGEDILSIVELYNDKAHIILYNPKSVEIGFILESFKEHFNHSHIIHSGLNWVDTNSYFELNKILVSNWHFLVPDTAKINFNWKATSDIVFLRKDVVKIGSGFDRHFSNIDVVLSEFSYRCMVAGARVKYVPLKDKLLKINMLKTSFSDEFRFISRHFGINPLFFLFGYFIIGLRFDNVIRLILWKVRYNVIKFRRNIKFDYLISHSKEAYRDRQYSAIIPTIDRYDYLDKAILSLLNNVCCPSEIIVVDQTPKERRIHEFYTKFPNIVKVFYQDKPGQCTSRNMAINMSENELILLFEDDAEAWVDMIDEHFKLMERSNADVSTGVSLAPWKDISYIPREINFYHNTDVLSSGNCLIKKSALMSVGGFHLAYNKGSGADDDLGRRLYLAGNEIVFNPFAIMTHHKAPSGGMRVHGAWWRNTSKYTQAFPPATELYTIRTYYNKNYEWMKVVSSFLNASKRSNLFQYLVLLILFPFKYCKSKMEYNKIINSLKSTN